MYKLLSCCFILQQLITTAQPLTTLEKDLICATRRFHTPLSHLSDLKTLNTTIETDAICTRLGFYDRWATMFPKHPKNELGVGEGLRAQVFISQPNKGSLIIAFRHFEHDMGTFADRDYWQQLMMYGIDEEKLNDPLWGWFWQIAQSTIRTVMHFFGFDYFKYSCHFVDEVLNKNKGKYPAVLFTGYGDGGAIAAMQVNRVAGSTGVIFGTRSIKDFADYFGYTSSKRVEIFALQDDDVVLGGNKPQPHRVCTFPRSYNDEDILSEQIKLNGTTKPITINDVTVYSDEFGLLSKNSIDKSRSCIEPQEN
jgi:hypothetical protein